MLKYYPGFVVGSILALFVATVLREYLPRTPFWLVIAFAVLVEVVRRTIKRMAVRRHIVLPQLSLKSFPGALVGSLIGFLAGLLFDGVFMGPVALIVAGALIGEAAFRLIRYAVPD